MRGSSLASVLLAALACGDPGVSLDRETETTGTGTGTTAAETLASTSEGPTPHDEPAICGPSCTPILTPTWTYEGPPGTYAVVQMLRDADGSLWLGIQGSQGSVSLARLSAAGELEQSVALGLTCERCELSGIALHPSGDVVLGATGHTGLGPDEAIVARFDVATNTVAWVRALALEPGDSTFPRLGELVVLDEDHIVALEVDGFSEGEVIEVLDLTGDGTLRRRSYMGAQRGSGGPWPPLVVRAPTGEVVMAHAWWDDETERIVTATSRVVPPYYSMVSLVQLPLRLDDLAVDGVGRRLELARSVGTDTLTLVLTSRRSSDPERWTTSLPLLTTSSTRPALAVGPDDQVYVAARSTPRAPPGLPATVMLEVARWSTDGALAWRASRPLEVMATPDPLEMVVDDDHGVIVGTVISGRATVTRYEQTCACE